MKAVFRIDANTVVGGGHFVRCLALADKLRQRGCQCMFMVKSLGIFFSEQLKQQEYPIVYVSDNSVESSIQALLAYDPLQQLYDWLVVDSYDLDCSYHYPLRKYFRQILVIDEMMDRRCDCDYFLNPSPSALPAEFDEICPGSTVLSGPDYALLREQFPQARITSLDRKRWPIKNVLVGVGSSDGRGVVPMLLRAVCEVDSELTVEVFSGSRAKSLPLLRQLAIELPNKITIRTDVSDMARLISRQDVIVTASGSIVWELCCLGMPSLLVVTAYNQSSNAKLLVNQGAANVVGSFLENEIAELAGKLAENLRVFKHSREVVEAISIRAAQLCDGLGADRVAQIMITRSKSQYG